MATVKMKKGVYYADVYDSPETIRQAQLDGYSLVDEKKDENETPSTTEERNEDVTETTEVENETPSKSVHKKYKK